MKINIKEIQQLRNDGQSDLADKIEYMQCKIDMAIAALELEDYQKATDLLDDI